MKNKIIWLIVVIVCVLMFIYTGFTAYNAGYETAEDDITQKLIEGDCINWIEFQCPGGNLYSFCEYYEIKEITGG